MTTDGKDILLESLLGEALSAETPPDLSGRILAALAERGRVAANGGKVVAAVALAPQKTVATREGRPNQPTFVREVAAAIAATRSLPSTSPSPGVARSLPSVAPAPAAERLVGRVDRDLRWQRLATAACLSAVALSAAVALLLYDRAKADHAGGATVATTEGPANPVTPSVTAPSPETAGSGAGEFAASPRARVPRSSDPILLPSPFDLEGSEVAADSAAEGAEAGPAESRGMFDEEAFASAAENTAGALATLPHVDDFRVLSLLDAEFEKIWSEAKVDPAPEAPHLLWVRRVYLRVLGRIPTVEELRQASESLTTFDRQRLVISLTERDEFYDYWAETLADEALGASDFEDSPVDRYQFTRYLAGRLRAGVPLHEIVAELIAAEGSNDPKAKDFDPAVNFLLSTVRTAPASEAPLPDEGVLAASRTARAFLGERAQCVQCHDHPENEWKQERFWQLAAFFQQTRVEGIDDGRARVVDRDLADEEMLFADPSGRTKAVLPVFHDFRIDPNGDVETVRRRKALSELVAASPEVYRALVHRVWKRFFGYGLAPVVDDLGPHREERFPTAVALLSEETAAHGGKLQDLVRWIALSEPFKRGSTLPRSKTADRPEEGTEPYFSRYYVRPLEPGTIYDSLLVAADALQAEKSKPEDAFAKKREWLAGFRPVRDSDEDPHVIESFDPTAPMILEMMHGELTRDALATESGSYLDRLAKSPAPPAAKMEHLFLTAFARMPNPQERALAARVFQANPKRPEEGLQNLWWALLNSNEFILDH
ncbi:MAG TPA: DUF1549 domain-containing protein [Pirellulaceae bacterium]|jgi:hypothetical protein|nr:DUF1549 domain-containing protein [Pirellulaceae bacterium]